MKTRMILAALLVFGAVVAMQAPASAVLITKSYLVGDKDDFDDMDDDATYDLVTGDQLLPGTGVGEMDLSELIIAEAGSTDRVLKALPSWPLFVIPDFQFTVDAAATAPVSGVLRVATWDVDYSSAGTWAAQPIALSAPGGNAALASLTTIQPRFSIRIDEIVLDAAALAAIGSAGGEVHVVIGSLATLATTDEAVIDFAELELDYRTGGGEAMAIPEASSAMALCTGLAGVLARRRRRS